ncbi:MAG: HD family phosphohydrolase, partial [Prevotella sp.]|nr:HD family phosphohydrolase [Prevotella sp.]
MKDKFISMLRSTGRQGVDSVIAYLEKVGFFDAPASVNHHLSYEGGLVEHSLNVHRMGMMLRGQMIEMKPELAEQLSEDSVTIAAL